MITATSLFAALTALLSEQTKLFTAVVASQPPAVSAALWTRFADDTEWIHKMLGRFGDHMDKLIGVVDPGPSK